MTYPPPFSRRHARQQLVLKVEFDDAEGFRSNFLSDLSEGGLRVNTVLEVGQRFTLNISFLKFVEPIQVEAVVQWTQGEDHEDGPASGLAFVDPTEDVRDWISEVLDAETNVHMIAAPPSRVVMLEAQAFLREIYGQEVRNWAELRDEEALDFIALETPDAWKDALSESPAMLGIVDVDGLSVSAMEIYEYVRSNPTSLDMPLIVVGSVNAVSPLVGMNDDLLFVLRKPLRFGVLMNTVRVLARDPMQRIPRPGSKSGL
ncbi:MAG TPA: PilZ domain-containing protein [Kofleriaceae bacterium]|nr:PilZ domain-containing protein [Kofleriaceae bacterium]